MEELIKKIEDAYSSEITEFDPSVLQLFGTFKQYLNSGRIRAAEKRHGKWYVNDWVKKGILLGFRLGQMVDYSINKNFLFFDKSTFPLKKFEITDNIRQVPGGSSIRDGTFVASGVVIMPPAYINVGAYIDMETMVDSHALVGSCAQIGKRVHISAGAQIGGVLEPIGAMPVIIEDNVLIGSNCGIFEGTIVSEHCVIGAGTILTGSTPVFDLVENQIYKKSETEPLLIPAGAVVVPGSRSIKNNFAEKYGISVYTPIIIKYRDEKTSAVTALEETLR
jgi:2,3,4,5-tetrahydropyridine-2-carboxylate N-succinyltransferase